MNDSDTAPIVLLTDFGLMDGYVGVMKGVIAGIAPQAPVIDLSHGIPPQAVDAAAFVLWNSHRYFPPGSIFVCVVDPGVGSARHILAVKAAGQIFIAPDNGLLDLLLTHHRPELILRVENEKVMRPQVSDTFHGRDIFAPTAAHLAAGFTFTQLGPVHSYRAPQSPLVEIDQPGRYKGRMLYADHFGNLVTNLYPRVKLHGRLRAGGVTVSLHRSYASVEEDQMLALRGSHGLVEMARRNGSAAQTLGLGPGDPVEMEVEAVGG